ncbi:bifunctional diguanylate cyclase/phosphodiesterase [Paenibacillus turpanensis]|uniref:bifunctional diguanylate cyclase/phosphodiesterase n=1 Tax=Paenibacillus turpanensis TaxID=2689078 RepID=UPI003132EFFC
MLSFVIAVLASYSALDLAGKISLSKGKNKTVWLMAGSCVMGIGVWSMHFVGMLAFELNIDVTYNITITVLSALASIAASFIAFTVTGGAQAGIGRIGIGGLAMGVGIVTMHYSGMAAMQMPAEVEYDPKLLALSVLIAFTASYAALLLFRRFRNSPAFSGWKLLCSLVMGLAICGMHYTGMAAAKFHPVTGLVGEGGGHGAAGQTSFLLIAVAVATLFILLISWGAIFFDRTVLERMAYLDPLTGLPNRYGLDRYFVSSFAEPKGAVLFIDLDRFKTINDTLGHDIGDLLLQEAGVRFVHCIGPSGEVFRLGGDEFLIALPGSTPQEAEHTAARIIDTIKQPYLIKGNELYVTASVGISLAPEHGAHRTDLMKAADIAMYQAKGSGKNKWELFNFELERRQVRRSGLEKDLRAALMRNEFFVAYQPKWDSVSNRLVGMEALLRWNHPNLGTVPPSEFIPISEETGMIVPITRWMLKEVCMQNVEWQAEDTAKVPISVNMSVRVFESGHLIAMVQDALECSGLPPEYIELEITESIAINDVVDAVTQLQQLRALGVAVSLDDFGTGYSSLGTLDQMPVNTLKIDQVFIRNSDQPSKQAIISNIITIAANLKLQVVAEGVETEEQIEFLQSRGCQVMQGYYYGKPMPREEMDRWLKSKQSA